MPKVECSRNPANKTGPFNVLSDENGNCPTGYYPSSVPNAPSSSGNTTYPSGNPRDFDYPSSGDPPDAAAWIPRNPYSALNVPQPGWDRPSPSMVDRYADPNSGLNATWATQTAADAAWYALSDGQQSLFTYIAQQEGNTSGEALYKKFVDQSASTVARGAPQTPYTLAYGYAVGKGWISEKGIAPIPGSAGPGSSGGGGGGAAAPTPVDRSSVKRMMDAMSSDLIGRTLSDEEFKRYYRSYTGTFSGNPEIDLQQHGTEALQGNDDYQEYQVAGKFAKAFDSVLRGAS